MEHKNWKCPKCGNRQFETGRFQATGGTFSKLFDIQNQKFTTVTCARCRYTEVYKADSNSLNNIFDFLTG
jgi:predicted nucleic-acid-binding Zn-ribbon protein